MAYVFAITVALVLYFVSLTASLIGPTPRMMLGTIAFLMTVTIVVFLASRQQHGKLSGIANPHPAWNRIRRLLWSLMIACVVVSIVAVIAMVIASGDAGVAAGSRPVFEEQAEYQLNSHGKYTTVTRGRYVIVGSSFMIGWHTFGILFALFGLHLALFGEWPPAFGPDQHDSRPTPDVEKSGC